MASKAVVLGGGGGTGVAWEIGIVVGLKQAGIDLNDADLIVGTSAGAMVGAQLRQGKNFVQLYQAQVELGAVGGRSPVRIADPATLQKVQEALQQESITEEVRRGLGRLALEAKGVQPAETFAGTITKSLGSSWPDRSLRTTAVDADDGSVVAFDREADVPLGRAVAISMCVPGMVEPILVGERRYIDGGMNGDNAHFASGYDVVLVLVTRDVLRTRGELEPLRAAGSTVVYAAPDAASAAALGEGADRFSVARRGPAAEEGARQGAALAAQLQQYWS